MITVDEGDLIYKGEDANSTPSSRTSASPRKGSAGAGGYRVGGEVRAAVKLLLRAGVPHEVLNAKNHAREAAIIAQAGRAAAVTVATNMAGRGTDIVLGGNPDFTADLDLREQGLSPSETPEEYEAAWPEALEEAEPRRPRPRPRRYATPGVCTYSARNGTSPAASTTSCVGAPVVRATRANRASTCRSATT